VTIVGATGVTAAATLETVTEIDAMIAVTVDKAVQVCTASVHGDVTGSTIVGATVRSMMINTTEIGG